MITVVIPFWNGNKTLGRLIASLPRELEIILSVDEGSEPPAIESIGKDCQIIYAKERGYFSKTVNQGIRSTQPTSDILILNQDVWFTSHQFFKEIKENAAIFGAFGDGVFNHPAWTNGYIQGTCMYIRRDALNDVGLFDEVYWLHWGTTCDWQLRMCRAGYKAKPMKVPGLRHDRKGDYGDATLSTLRKNPDLSSLLIRTPPLVSVIVPCYNYGRYLQDCINSLIGGTTSLGKVPGQTFSAFEIILVDDFSTDDSAEMIKNYVNPWKGIRAYFHDRNQGTSGANNTGMEHAIGKYVTHLSADDMRESGSLERLLKICLANPHSFAYDDVIKFKNGKQFETWKLADYDFDNLLVRNFIHAGIMLERLAWLDVGGYPTLMFYGREDWAMNVALGIAGYCGIHVKEPGYLYRREGANRSLRNVGDSWREVFSKQMYELFKPVYDGERPAMCCGKGRTEPVKPYQALNRTAVPLAGHEGMVLLQYIGGGVGKQTIYGPATGARYVFDGNHRKQFWVAVKDTATNGKALGLLQLARNGKPLFRVIQKILPRTEKPVKPAPEPEVIPVQEPNPVIALIESATENNITPLELVKALETTATPPKRGRKKKTDVNA